MESLDDQPQTQNIFTWRHFTPGLVYIVGIDLLVVSGWWDEVGWLHSIWFIPLLLMPWMTAFAGPGRLRLMGFHRRRWLANFGWGLVAGGVWRLVSIGFNLAMTGSGVRLLGWGEIINAMLIVPWIEETFFRGYLGRGLSLQIGMWPGILIQSILFSLHPVHWDQGGMHLVSIFGFGLLAGWLVERSRSIWTAWGAHGFANLIPIILRSFA